jgi:SAM-dependent methyltransferase
MKARVAEQRDVLRSLIKQSAARLTQGSGAEQASADQPVAILEAYCREAPSPQTAVDTFAGEWASALPPPLDGVRVGAAPLFSVEHVPWGVGILGGVEGKRVLELGPLEGGHTYMLDRLGAKEVCAVEANRRAYLKCLITKELLGIPSARFLCGDFVRYLETELAAGRGQFDLCLASGVLYHLRDPVAGLHLMCRASDRLLLWTHYYDPAYMATRSDLAQKFPSAIPSEYEGFKHTLYRQEYQDSLSFTGFCGGLAESSSWMTRDDILRALDHFGFGVAAVNFEEQNHKGNGPCFCVAATRLSLVSDS